MTLNAPPAAVWPLVADTERMNRATGLPAVHYAPVPRSGGGSTTIGEYRLGPVVMARWTERAFDWQAPRYYTVDRSFHGGPIATFQGGMQLVAIDADHTDVRVWADFEPRLGLLGRLLVDVVGRCTIRRWLRQLEVFERFLTGQIDSAFPSLDHGSWHDEPADVTRERLQHTPWDALTESATPDALVSRLHQHLEQAADLDVLNMRPLALADGWGLDRLEVLSMFLRGAQAGIMDMHWDALCPHCRTAKVRSATLGLLQPKAFCATCALEFEVSFERNVELRFDVARGVRTARADTYCETGPMQTSHRLAQITLAPHAVAALDVNLGTGSHRVLSRQSSGQVGIEATPHATGVGTRLISVYADRMGPPTLSLPSGPAVLTVANHTDVPITVHLEHTERSDLLATPALVSSLSTFRDLFSTDVLAAGQQVAIGRLAFLAVGIADPVGLYAALGQGRGFKLVDACVSAIRQTIEVHHGVVTGDLGERVLAAFAVADDALQAAVAIQRGIAHLEEDGVDTARLVRIGVHEGPCLAATVARRINYFGVAPSITLSLLDAALDGEIALSAAIGADGQVAGSLGDVSVEAEMEQHLVSTQSMPFRRIHAWRSAARSPQPLRLVRRAS